MTQLYCTVCKVSDRQKQYKCNLAHHNQLSNSCESNLGLQKAYSNFPSTQRIDDKKLNISISL